MAADVSVTVGVDTHSDAHVGVALDQVGRRLGEVATPNDEDGYRRLLRWASSLGELDRVGVEGTGSYGAGLSRFLRSGGLRVIEVDRLSRQHRRRHGKHDGAVAAARAVLSGEATGEPKAADGCVEMIRALKVARRSAVKAKTQAANQLHALVMSAPKGSKQAFAGFPYRGWPRRLHAFGARHSQPIRLRQRSSPYAAWLAVTSGSPSRSQSSKNRSNASLEKHLLISWL